VDLHSLHRRRLRLYARFFQPVDFTGIGASNPKSNFLDSQWSAMWDIVIPRLCYSAMLLNAILSVCPSVRHTRLRIRIGRDSHWRKSSLSEYSHYYSLIYSRPRAFDWYQNHLVRCTDRRRALSVRDNRVSC